jgi:hypothetical protein
MRRRPRLTPCPRPKNFFPLALACGADIASARVPGRKVFLLLFVHKKKSSYLPACPVPRAISAKAQTDATTHVIAPAIIAT